jgi:hypothetical protein
MGEQSDIVGRERSRPSLERLRGASVQTRKFGRRQSSLDDGSHYGVSELRHAAGSHQHDAGVASLVQSVRTSRWIHSGHLSRVRDPEAGPDHRGRSEQLAGRPRQAGDTAVDQLVQVPGRRRRHPLPAAHAQLSGDLDDEERTATGRRRDLLRQLVTHAR